MKLTIDNRKIEAADGMTVLEAAKKANIYIPTLCYQENLSPDGACRLCTIEITAGGTPGVTTACTYPAAEGLVVSTKSEKAVAARKLALELLLGQHPHSDILARLAAEMGMGEPRFSFDEDECIRCRLCVRTCKERVGARAITFIDQGIDRDAPSSVQHSYEKCIGCDSCAYICPTKAITVKDSGDTRVLSTPSGELKFKLAQCKACGRYWAPQKQLEWISGHVSLPAGHFDTCPDCRP